MKRYEFVFNTDKQCVIDSLLGGVIKPDFMNYLKVCEQDTIYGRLSQNTNKIFLYHGALFRNSCRPVFSAKITEGDKTVLSGFWRLPVYTIIFLIIWYAILIRISVIPLLVEGQGNLPMLYVILAFFALCGGLITVLGVKLEKKRMQKVIDYIENVQKRFS